MQGRRRVLSAHRFYGPSNPSVALCEAADRLIKHVCKGTFSHTLHNCKKSARFPLSLQPRLPHVSTADQANDAQVDELKDAGCRTVREEH
jgi:hypothetical protein